MDTAPRVEASDMFDRFIALERQRWAPRLKNGDVDDAHWPSIDEAEADLVESICLPRPPRLDTAIGRARCLAASEPELDTANLSEAGQLILMAMVRDLVGSELSLLASFG